MWQKRERLSGRTHTKPTYWEIGDLEKNQEIGNFETLEGSGNWKFGGLGDPGDWGKSLNVAKIKNLLEIRRKMKIEKIRRPGKFWGTRRLGRFGKTGYFRNSKDRGKSLYVAKK